MSLINQGDGITVIRVRVVDQAALPGLVQKLRDLNLLLVSVTRSIPDRTADRPSTAHRAPRADWNGGPPDSPRRHEFRWTG
jgi:hypothetical protein